MAVLFAITKMPEVTETTNKVVTQTKITIASLLKNRHLTLGIIAQFCNVGAQVSLWGNFVDLKIDLASDINLWIVQKYIKLLARCLRLK